MDLFLRDFLDGQAWLDIAPVRLGKGAGTHLHSNKVKISETLRGLYIAYLPLDMSNNNESFLYIQQF